LARQLKLLDGEVPALSGHVTDKAGLLDAADRKVLDHILTLYEQRTGHQFAILTVPDLRGATVADFGFTVASRAGLGRRGKDDGLLITVAREERTVDIQVGSGLERAIPDELASRVIRENMAPAFRTKSYANGLREGTTELMRAGETVQ
jgi:uncharacterized protein